MSELKLKVDRKKSKTFTYEDLCKLSQKELIDITIQLQANNLQLRNVIAKKMGSDSDSVNKKKRPFDFSRYLTRRIILRIVYVGANYRGLAVQEDCADTIEAHLFSALTKSCLIKCREESSYHRCGRTDKGVSASGQVLSLEVRSCLSEAEMNSEDGGIEKELQYCKILNRLLPEDIRAISWAPALMNSDGEYCSARFDCKQRTYKYWFPRGSLSICKMEEACKQLVGTKDFRNLCKMDVANGVTSFIRDLSHASIVKETEISSSTEGYDMYYLLIKANAFLWHQIRCIAGVLFLIGQGNEDVDIISQLLDVETNPRKPQYSMAVDFPLNLYHCSYEFLDDYTEQYRSDHVPEQQKGFSNESSMNSLKCDEKKKYPSTTGWFVDLEDLTLVIRSFQIQWSKLAVKAAMIKDIIKDLENLYDYYKTKSKMKNSETSNNENVKFCYQSDCMLEGVKQKVYKPLLKRQKCESLENRIDHYVNKKRLKKLSETENN